MGIKVLIAEKDNFLRKNLKERLLQTGYDVVGEAEDGISALKMTRSLQPELVLVSADLPVMSGLELTGILEENRISAVVLMVDYADRHLLFKGEKLIVPVLVKPFDEFQLFSSLEYAYSTYRKLSELEREISKLKNDLETRKLVEKAKGILMKLQQLTEDDAFKKLQKYSMKKRMSMKKVAEAVIAAYEMQRDNGL